MGKCENWRDEVFFLPYNHLCLVPQLPQKVADASRQVSYVELDINSRASIVNNTSCLVFVVTVVSDECFGSSPVGNRILLTCSRQHQEKPTVKIMRILGSFK